MNHRFSEIGMRGQLAQGLTVTQRRWPPSEGWGDLVGRYLRLRAKAARLDLAFADFLGVPLRGFSPVSPAMNRSEE